MSGFANAVIGGAKKLIREAIESTVFQTGVSGWAIRKNGSAEFNNLTARGRIEARLGNAFIALEPSQPDLEFNPNTAVYQVNGTLQFIDLAGSGVETILTGVRKDTQGVPNIHLTSNALPNGSLELRGSEITLTGAPTVTGNATLNADLAVAGDVRYPARDVLATGSVSNTINETVIGAFSPAVDAGCSQHQAWAYEIYGSADSDNTSPTLTFRIRLDSATGTQVAAFGAITYLAAGGSGRRFCITGTLYVSTSGASGVLEGNSRIDHIIAATGFAQTQTVVAGTSAVDLTTAHTLVVTAQWSTANASRIARTLTGSIRRISTPSP